MTGRLRASLALVRARIGRGTSARGFYAKQLRYGELAFDIGASAGIHTDAMLRRGARVVAVEPQAELAETLRQRYPEVTVLAVAVGAVSGRATLHTSAAHDQHATLSESWVEVGEVPFDGASSVEVTTLDTLIGRYGVPSLIKLDVEGWEDQALAGLSQPVETVLFEIHDTLLEVAERALQRLDSLGSYEYRLMHHDYVDEPWTLGRPTTAEAILSDPPDWADVYARLVPRQRHSASRRPAGDRGSDAR